jgi:Flp pilus assembly protein TadD
MRRRFLQLRRDENRDGLRPVFWAAACCYLLSCASSPYSAYNRGVQFSKEGLIPEAEMAFQESVQRDPRNDDAWNQLGVIAFDRKDLDLAERRFRKASELNRLNPVYPRNLALVFAERNDCGTARELLRKSAALDPADPTTSLTLGKVLWLEGKHEEALQAIDKALALDPANSEAQELRSRLQPPSK